MRTFARLLLAAIISIVVSFDATVSARDRGWFSLFDTTRSRPEAGLILVRWGASPVSITANAFSTVLSGPDVRLSSVALFNPSWERVESARIYWVLYRDDNLTVPSATGVSQLITFAKPLWIRDGTTMKVDVSLPIPEDHCTYRLEVGVDIILYQGGAVWQRPPRPESVSPHTAQPN